MALSGYSRASRAGLNSQACTRSLKSDIASSTRSAERPSVDIAAGEQRRACRARAALRRNRRRVGRSRRLAASRRIGPRVGMRRAHAALLFAPHRPRDHGVSGSAAPAAPCRHARRGSRTIAAMAAKCTSRAVSKSPSSGGEPAKLHRLPDRQAREHAASAPAASTPAIEQLLHGVVACEVGVPESARQRGAQVGHARRAGVSGRNLRRNRPLTRP